MTPHGTAALDLHDAVALWSAGLNRGYDVVMSACDALVAGLDSPSLRRVASLSAREADVEITDLLPAMLEELSLSPLPRDNVAGRNAVAASLAAQMLAGRFTPQELAAEIHRLFSHDLPLAERLARLDDEYDTLGYHSRTAEELDAEITIEAQRLAATGHSPPPR